MPAEPIPFVNMQRTGHERLGGAGRASMNVLVDGSGVVRRRPGIQAAARAGSAVVDDNGIDGLFVTSTGTTLAVSSAVPVRTIYRVASGASAAVGGANQFSGPDRPVFAETEAMVAIAAGAGIYKVLTASNESSLLGGGPPNATHVAFNASRLLCNDVILDRSKVNFSDVAGGSVYTGHETWGGAGSSGFFSAEARPDPVVAIAENSNEVFVWGATNLEVYAPDPLYGFARAITRDYGCIAPYSIVRFDQSFVWLDHRKRMVQSNGRQVTDISEDIGPDLETLDVAGCFGYRVVEGPADVMVWTFPAAGKTYCYQVGAGWSQWSSFSGGQWGAFPVTAHAHDPTTDTNLVGLSSGRVCELADGIADDLGDPIHAFVETGFIDRGSSRTKVCQRVRFTLERGQTAGTTEPVALVQWADRPGAWSAPRPIGLGVAGDTRPVVTLHAPGTYRSRAWRFTFSSTEPLALVRAEEEFAWGAD